MDIQYRAADRGDHRSALQVQLCTRQLGLGGIDIARGHHDIGLRIQRHAREPFQRRLCPCDGQCGLGRRRAHRIQRGLGRHVALEQFFGTGQAAGGLGRVRHGLVQRRLRLVPAGRDGGACLHQAGLADGQIGLGHQDRAFQRGAVVQPGQRCAFVDPVAHRDKDAGQACVTRTIGRRHDRDVAARQNAGQPHHVAGQHGFRHLWRQVDVRGQRDGRIRSATGLQAGQRIEFLQGRWLEIKPDHRAGEHEDRDQQHQKPSFAEKPPALGRCSALRQPQVKGQIGRGFGRH